MAVLKNELASLRGCAGFDANWTVIGTSLEKIDRMSLLYLMRAKSHVLGQCSADAVGLQIIVEDDGSGIPFGQRDAILEPGKRLESTTPGAGFGLAIVAELVESYGGTIQLDDVTTRELRVCDHLPGSTVR